MRVIIISVEPYLGIFLKIANKNLDIASIVMPLDKLIQGTKTNLNNEKTCKIFAYAYLKECLSNTYYDYIIVALPPGDFEKYVLSDLETLNVDREKVFRIGGIYMDQCSGFLSLIQYVKKDISKYKILVTGVSHAKNGTDVYAYKYPTLNLAVSSQDLYYDYLFAKKFFEMKNSAFKYAVIGLAPFSLHYDESHRGGGYDTEQFYLLPYYLAFKDFHNFHINDETIKYIFDEQFLKSEIISDPAQFNLDVYNKSPSRIE